VKELMLEGNSRIVKEVQKNLENSKTIKKSFRTAMTKKQSPPVGGRRISQATKIKGLATVFRKRIVFSIINKP
jgi:hypothetical protein